MKNEVQYILISRTMKGNFIYQVFYNTRDAFLKKEDLDIAKRRKTKICIGDNLYKAQEVSFLGIFKLVRVRSEFSGI